MPEPTLSWGTFWGDARASGLRWAGLAGCGISQSRSPHLHETEARVQGFNLRYPLFDFEDPWLKGVTLGDLIARARSEGFLGLNITHPFKSDVVGYLDSLAGDAEITGTVNTVVFRNGTAVGHNTDVVGFSAVLAKLFGSEAPGRVLQVGTGGAGAATAVALVRAGCSKLYLHDVDPFKAERLRDRLLSFFSSMSVEAVTDPGAALPDVEGLVNATPIGMAGHPGLPIPLGRLSPRHWVADIIYFPLETELLKKARELGCITANGEVMVIEQAAAAYDLFVGQPASRDRMKQAFRCL